MILSTGMCSPGCKGGPVHIHVHINNTTIIYQCTGDSQDANDEHSIKQS